MRLRTIGYEGLSIEEFWARLVSNGIETLVDVREVPFSRKPGFSKARLAQAASEHGICYLHLPSLGCPKEIRYAYREDNDWSLYTTRFKAYLETQDLAVAELARLVAEQECCLLCFEADPAFCHRSYVAEKVATHFHAPFTIHHITALTPSSTASHQQVLAWADR